MPSNQTNINIGVKYNVDQSSVNAVKKSLQDLQNIKPANFSGTKTQLDDIKKTAKQVQSALDAAFNVNLNSLNVQTFNQQLKTAGLTVDQVYQTFAGAGAQGQVAFRNMTSSILTTNLQLKQTKSLLTSMGETMVNTVKWGIASSVMNSFTNSVRQAFQYAKSLDGALTDIRIVTGDSTEQMRQFAKQANNAAQNLGRSTMDYTKAALSFYQQGLSDEEVKTRTQTVLKAQNITGAGEEMADYLTAVWNGYKVANQEAELYVDKLAAVADSSASNMSQLAVAMSKVASSANALGVPVDNLNAQIATIVATTRQAPESVGNALKTIYSRINDITTGAEDAQVSLGNYSKQMAAIGFSVLDANGNLRDTGDVIDEIGGKWQTLSREQQIYLARTMAGQRQYNNLIALFDNWGKYTDLVNVSMEAQGTTMQKNARYMDSLEAKMEQLGAAGERVKDALIDEEDLKGLASFGTQITNIFASFIEGIGGGRGALLNLVSVITTLFAPAISKELTSVITGFQQVKNNAAALSREIQQTREFGISKSYSNGLIKEIVDAKRQIQQYYSTMTKGQIQSYNAIVNNLGAQQNRLTLLQDQKKAVQQFQASVTSAGNKLGNDLTTQLTVAADVTKDLKEELKDLSVNDLKDQNVFDELVRQVQQLQETVGDRAVPAFEKFDNVLKQIQTQSGPATTKQLADLRIASQAALDQTNNLLAKDLDVTKAKISQTTSEIQKLKNAKNEALSNAQAGAFSKNLVTYLSSFAQIVSSLNNISRIISVIRDDSLTTGEKISQVLTTSLFTAVTLISAYRRITTALGVQSLLAEKQFLTKKKENLQLDKQIAKETLLAAIRGRSTGATTAEDVIKARQNYQLLGQQIKNVTLRQGQLGSAWGLVKGKISTGIGSILNLLMGPAGLAVAFGAVAAVIGVQLYKAWNSASDSAKKAAQTARQAKEQYDSIKDSINDLNSSFSNLTSAKDNLDSLTKGTKEWDSALQDVNNQVLDLIQKFPELKEFITSNDGQLGFKEDAEEYIKNLYNQRQLVSSLAYAAADRESTEASNYSLITEASRNRNIGAGLGVQQLEEVVNAINEHGNWILENSEVLSNYVDLNQQQIQAVIENSSSINKLATEIKNNTIASQNLTSSLLKGAISDSKYYQNSQNQQAFSILAEKVFKENAQLGQQYYISTPSANTMTGQIVGQSYSINPEALAKRWAQSLGKTFGDQIDVTFGGQIRQKVNGQWQKVNQKTVELAVAQYDALQNAEQKYQEIDELIKSLGRQQSQLLVNFIQGYENLSLQDIQKLQDPNNAALRKAIADTLKGGEKQLDAQLLQYAQDIEEGTKKYYSDLPHGVVTALDKIDPDRTGLSDAARRQITQVLKKAFIEGKGIEGIQQNVADVIQDAVNSDKLNQLLDIDVSNLELDDFKELLKQIGVQTDASDESLQAFLNTMKGFSEGQLTADEIYNNIHNILDKKNGKTIEYNDQISPEDYEKLKQAGVAVEGAFQKVHGGMYRFIGDAEQFYKQANQVSLQPYYKQIDELKSKLQQLQSGGSLSAHQLANYNQWTRDSTGEWNVNYDVVQKQVDALSAASLISDEELSKYNELIKLRAIDSTSLQEIKQKIQDNQAELQNYIGKQQESTKEQLHQLELQQAFSQQDLGQLRDLRNREDQPLNLLTDDQYIQALIATADAEGLVKENVQALAEQLASSADQLQHTNDDLKDHRKECYEVAAAAQDLVVGIEGIQKAWKETTKEQVEAAGSGNKVLAQTTALISDMFNQDVGEDFVTAHLAQIERIAQGDLAAVQDLGVALGLLRINDVRITTQLDTTTFDAEVADLQDKIQGQDWGQIQFGATIDGADFYNALQKFIIESGATQEQINKILAGIGYDPDVDYRTVTLHKGADSGNGTEYYVEGTLADGTQYRQVVSESFANQYEDGATITVPIIKGSKFVGGAGNLGRIGGSRTIPQAPKSSGGKKGGGGKGKGSTPKAATKAKINTTKIDTNQKEADHNPYQQEQKSFQRQQKLLDDLQDKQKKLVNKDRLKNLQQQNKTLEEQKKILQKELAISANAAAENSTANYADRLRKEFGKALQFDSDGQISDINALEAKNAQIYNAAAKSAADAFEEEKKAYNDYIQNTWNKYTTQDQQNANKAEKERWDDRIKAAEQNAKNQIKKAEEGYKAREDLINQYNKAWEEDQKRAEQIQKITDEIYEKRIEMSKIKVDLAIDTGDFERDWLDFENKVIKKLNDDDILGTAKANAKELMSYFNSDQVQQTAKQIESIRNEIALMQGGTSSNIYGTNLAQAKEDLEQYMKQQMDDLGDVQELIDDIKENYLDGLDEAKEKMDDQIDQYERVNDLIDHNVKLVQMLYGDKAYDTMNKYYDMQKANNEDTLNSLRMQQQYWQNLFNNIERDKDGNILNKEEYNKIKENLDDVTDHLNDKLEEMIQNLSDQWANRVDGIIARLNNALTGGRGLDYLDEQWDFINDYDDNFLDTFESKMGIDEVTNLYQQAIDGLSGSPANQQKINKLMNDQLKILREKDHLTEYDIERAKAALEVEKARMALEDARYNKTKMRLRRDSQGNYTYQYVADEQKLGDLQSALADAQANLYNMDKEHYTENLNKLYDTYKDYLEKMRDLTEEYNSTQDEEERARISNRIEMLKTATNNLMQGLTEDNKYTLQYLNESFFGGMGIDTSLMSAEQQMDMMIQNIPQMNSNIQDLANTIVGQGGILNATADAINEISEATNEYDANVKEFLNDAGTSLEVVRDVTDTAGAALDQNILQAQSLVIQNQKLIDSCMAEVEALQELLDYIDKYLNKVMNISQLIENLRGAYNTGQNLNGSTLTADNIAVVSNNLDTTTGMEYSGNPATDAKKVKSQIDALMAEYEKFLEQMSIATFDTGGATGSWGDASGRLAFLHQKELVLNETDTENILRAVQAVRMMTSIFSGAAAGDINSLTANSSGLLSGINTTEQLDQNVHIEANFPNVTQHTEIEQAFNNLVNMASMRASRYTD